METIQLNTGHSISNIYIGESISNLANYIPKGKKAIILTDSTILKYYGQFLKNFEVIELEQGEQNKNLATIHYIMGRLVELEADRSSFIVGVGGGIVSDITGFAASIYMRGLRFGFVTTTLLAQVDASVGGKNGVNFEGFKNMVGVFNQPEFVICDTAMLATLDKQEYIGGYAEIIKHGAIKDEALFEFLEKNYTAALNLDTDVINRCVSDSVAIKARVVEADEREAGERRKLNFGHTFGHAIEKLTGMPHGQAVAVGMCMAARASVQMGLLQADEAVRLIQLIRNFTLPVELKFDPASLFNAMKKDKKREGTGLHLVLLEKIGKAVVVNVSYNELEGILNDMR